jgi:hypothetical protein
MNENLAMSARRAHEVWTSIHPRAQWAKISASSTTFRTIRRSLSVIHRLDVQRALIEALIA